MDKYIKRVKCEVCEIPIGETWEKESGEHYVMKYINYPKYETRPICSRCKDHEEIRKHNKKEGIYARPNTFRPL